MSEALLNPDLLMAAALIGAMVLGLAWNGIMWCVYRVSDWRDHLRATAERLARDHEAARQAGWKDGGSPPPHVRCDCRECAAWRRVEFG